MVIYMNVPFVDCVSCSVYLLYFTCSFLFLTPATMLLTNAYSVRFPFASSKPFVLLSTVHINGICHSLWFCQEKRIYDVKESARRRKKHHRENGRKKNKGKNQHNEMDLQEKLH